MIITILVILFLYLLVIGFMKLPQFGRAASGKRLERIRQSPNYRNGEFQNKSNTPMFQEGENFFSVFKKFFFEKSRRNRPSAPIPSQKTDLHHLNSQSNLLVWFGHSSYFMQVDGKKILVDPVFSGHASPVSFTTKSFPGTDVYGADDMPQIDYLFLSHDHWDHLDYSTLQQLKPKIKKIITGLGVGAHLERWGFDPSIIEEKDWDEELLLEEGFKVHTATARHFSGRGFKRNQSIWLSFIFLTPSKKIFLGGDSGYDVHFKSIGSSFGPFDLAILEDGQYNQSWKYIHMLPEEVVQAAIDLQARRLLPVHWGKFALSIHDWDEPIRRAVAEARKKQVLLVHPMIGAAIDLDSKEEGPAWWAQLSQKEEGKQLAKPAGNL